MLLNIILIFVVFGLTRWKKYPYAGAVVLGLLKSAHYLLALYATFPLWVALLNSVIAFTVFAALAAGMVYFLRRLDRGESKPVTYTAGGNDRMVFKWEYIPLAVIVVLMIFGEFWINNILSRR
jgi:heme/copper-type cytochrome/quinol oxidase subunit 2